VEVENHESGGKHKKNSTGEVSANDAAGEEFPRELARAVYCRRIA